MPTPAENTRTLIASCDTWQTITDTETVAAAAAFIYLQTAEVSAKSLTAPYATLTTSTRTRTRVSNTSFDHSGTIMLKIVLPQPSAATDIDTERASIDTTIDALAAEIEELAVSEGYISLQEIRLPSQTAVRDARERSTTNWIIIGELDWPGDY